jgi:hypothetical protein
MNNDQSTERTAVVDEQTVTLTVQQWQAWRKAAGLHIDPETAEVLWDYTQVLDPYGIWPDIPEECDCVGRSYLARSPGMNVWIEFGDLPGATRDALRAKHESQLAFPAGLDFIGFAQTYVEQNFGPICGLHEDEFGKAMTAAHQAYLAEKTGREEGHDNIKGEVES